LSEVEDVRVLFVGDDWAEDHHDVEVQDETGRRLAKARLPEGISGITRLHALVGRFLPEDGDAAGVKIGIETDRGPWVAALVASGCGGGLVVRELDGGVDVVLAEGKVERLHATAEPCCHLLDGGATGAAAGRGNAFGSGAGVASNEHVSGHLNLLGFLRSWCG
jgi:hypothetical protein